MPLLLALAQEPPRLPAQPILSALLKAASKSRTKRPRLSERSSVKEVPMTIPKKERPKMIASSSSYITASTPRGQKRALPVEDENPPEDEIYCGWKDCKTTRSFPSVYAVITHVKDVHRVGRDKNGKHRCMWRGCDARVIDLGKHLRGSGRNDAHAVLSTILKQDQKKKAKLGF
ncbi:hypothetical protein MPER_04387 [Moniliophthora perniciosa FA553]|nr:hypothetical protein MPER_04387 [Moniliophthora perniciosa FA553]